MILATQSAPKNIDPRRSERFATGGRVIQGFEELPRPSVYCTVAYRDELETRAEVGDWSGSPLAAGGRGIDSPATEIGRAIDKHVGRVFDLFFQRSHE